MKYLALFTLLAMAGITACHKDKPLCDGSSAANCTTEFVTISTRVTDAGGSPVLLDDYYTTRNSNGQQIRISATIHDGYYPILDDSYQQSLACTQEVFIFHGFKNGTEVVSANYTLGADQCHIVFLKGSLDLKAR